MKLNWLTFAFTLFGAFAVFMIGMVVFASMQSHELVTENYYEKELEFKEILKKEDVTNQLKEQLTWKINNNEIVFQFPKEVTQKIAGNLIFFKPSSQKEDKEIPFETSTNSYTLSLQNFASGMYKVKIDWSTNTEKYYNEEEIVIP